MFGNVLVLMVFIALTVGAGWLVLKAWRAQRLWVKIAGTLGAGLLTIFFGAIAFFGGKGIGYFYFPGADAAPELVVEGTPEQIARGEYLADIGCILCHGTYEGDTIDFNPEFPLAGGLDLAAAEEALPPVGRLVSENLTPAGKLADYTDGELFRAIRHGINRNGHRTGFMGLLPFGQMNDDDIIALIAFIRSQPQVEPEGPTGTSLNYLGMVFFGAGLFPPAEDNPDSIPALQAGPTAEYGEYVATFGECRGCHGPNMTGTPADAFFEAVPNPRPLVKTMDLDAFIEMFRTGVRPGNNPFPDAMPWRNASRMSDTDLEALYVYLTTEP